MNIHTLRKLSLGILLLTNLLNRMPASAQTLKVYSYEGFDYYANTTFFANTTLDGRGTEIPTVSPTPIPLHGINNDAQRVKTNSATSLGWAGDWLASNAAGSNGFYQVGTTPSSTVTSQNTNFSLVNSGLFAVGGQAGVTVGRRLQTSTGGPFYEFDVISPFPANNDPLINQYRHTPASLFPWSTYITTNTASTLTASTVPPRTRVDHPSSTPNNFIGADGTTAWFACLIRKNNPNNEECFVTLHRNATVFDNTGANSISVGYFNDPALSFGADRYWGIRVGGSTVLAPAFTPNSKIEIGEFDLLVLGITFNSTGTNLLRLYVLHNVDAGNPAYGVNFNLYGAGVNPDGSPSLITEDISQSVAGDFAFHSLAYFGGSNANESALDEIRFGNNFKAAALASSSISLIKGLCSGLNGSNIYSQGNFGTALSVNNNGVQVGPTDATEVLGSNGTWSDFVDGAGNSPRPPIFKRGDALLGGLTYESLAPGFVYVPNNQTNPSPPPNGTVSPQPDDGGFAVVTQSRIPFGNGYGAGGTTPSWLKTYDNSGGPLDITGASALPPPVGNGLMMVVNASYSPGNFYERRIGGICSGTQYEFFMDVVSLFRQELASSFNTGGEVIGNPTGTCTGCPSCYCSPSCDPSNEPGCQQMSWPGIDQAGFYSIGAATNGSVDKATPEGRRYNLSPEVEFLIDDVPVYIPPIPVVNDGRWHRIGFTFVTKNLPTGDVKLTIRNRARGGNGNDLAIDNITFRPCGPRTENDPNQIDCGVKRLRVKVLEAGAGYDPAFYRWQYQELATGDWKDFPGAGLGGTALVTAAPNDSLDLLDPVVNSRTEINSFVRAIIAGSEANTDNVQCSVFSVPVFINCVLPVSWLSFKGQAFQEGVKLEWQTGYEKNVENFVVERSEDGINFVGVGTVSPKGKDGKDFRSDYFFWDRNPVSGLSYYRIREANRSRNDSYSKTISIVVGKDYIMVFPNPADKLLTVSFSKTQANEIIKVSFTSLIGKKVKQVEKRISAGDKDWEISVTDLPAGVYLVEIRTETQQITRKIVITR